MNNMSTEWGTPEQIKKQYEVEKKLANKLRNSTKDERKLLYKGLYNELFKRVPWHPLLTVKENERSIRLRVQQQLRVIEDFINKDTVFMEIGAGDCSLALELTKRVRQVYAIDVSDEITKMKKSLPDNFKLIISDGISIEVPMSSVDIAYSNHLIEHLYPDDIDDHIQNVRNALKLNGIYIILTPHRFRGPSDISKYFDRVATGFHLKEWIFSELKVLFKKHKFSKTEIYCLKKGFRIKIPTSFIKVIEYFLGKIPYLPRKKVSNLFFRGLFYVVAKK